jgi:signal transduction histidine kinase
MFNLLRRTALMLAMRGMSLSLGAARQPRHIRVQAVAAREDERRRIRREIHDGIGPLLAAALLRTETAMELPSGSPLQDEALQQLHNLQKTAISDIHSLLEGLRPPALEHGDLLAALRQHAEIVTSIAGRSSPTVRFGISNDISMLPDAIEFSAYRIAQEAISNAIRHSCAQRITVRITRGCDGLTIDIEDDGIGVAAENNPLGVGLTSMTERATELGGWCISKCPPTGGTHIQTWLPITQRTSMGRRVRLAVARLATQSDRRLPSKRPRPSTTLI